MIGPPPFCGLAGPSDVVTTTLDSFRFRYLNTIDGGPLSVTMGTSPDRCIFLAFVFGFLPLYTTGYVRSAFIAVPSTFHIAGRSMVPASSIPHTTLTVR